MTQCIANSSWSRALVLSIGLAVGALASGCDCSGGEGSCETSSDCSGSRRCIDGFCLLPRDAAGGDGVDASLSDANVVRPDTGPAIDAGPCRAVSAESTIEPIPVDIIIAIDNSGSMTEEAAEVRTNINLFAEIIAASGLDYRVVLISAPTGDRGVCVPPPLGTGAPACASGPEGRLLALHVTVSSRNAPDLVLSQYPMYVDFLRPEAAKVFLWITDDESNVYTADSFREAIAALAPAGMFDRTIHNSIVGYYGDAMADWGRSGAGSCGSLARVGTTYMRLATCVTNAGDPIADCLPGSTARVCEADWRPIFEEIAMGVVAGVPVVCEFDVPAPPEGSMLDLDEIRVTWRSGDVVRSMLDRVEGMATCTANGWYFDDPVAPTQIVLCPDVCRDVQADPDAQMDIALGCFPILE
ncbi:MAG: hypothetical protein M3Y87_09405 [Myxococcota bacterium]|nr:hypothetical protein [Myxococcota bacterium]